MLATKVSSYVLTLERSAVDRAQLTLRSGEAILASAQLGCSLGSLTPQELEQIRWYWEDYLDRPGEASRRTARGVEDRLREVGAHLFETLFSAADARKLWTTASQDLSRLRFEIRDTISDPREPPWELLYEAQRGVWLAAACGSFVRRPYTSTSDAATPDQGPLRVLTVLSPPDRTGRSAFRSAYRRIADTAAEEGAAVVWDVLRPPTLARLSGALLEAEAMERPYHVVHFEGSGVFLDPASTQELPAGLEEASFPAADNRNIGLTGYLLFDHAQDSSRLRLVSALDLAELLGEARTPLLALTNSCERPTGDALVALPLDAPRAFQAIAVELSAVSSVSVIQIPYRLDPDTVAKFYAKAYGALAEGFSPGEAVAAVRAEAADNPTRTSVFERTERHDAPVLRLHEAHPTPIIDRPRSAFLTDSGQSETDVSEPGVKRADPRLPQRPRGGCFGLDGLLVDIDRLFHGSSCVLLCGDPGSGKTIAAAEYCRWVRASDGLDGPVVYTSLEGVRSVASLVDRLSSTFAEPLAGSGYAFEQMEEAERLETTLFVLNQIPTLWIWDNFEIIRGDARQEPWPEEEVEKLHDALHKLIDTQVRLLIVSRDGEKWLKTPVRRRRLTPLPLRERLLVARSLLQSLHFPTREFERWMPVVEASRGNPMLLRLLVRQALHEGLGGTGDLSAFLDRALGALAGPGGSNRENDDLLAPALRYVYERGFGENEKEILSLAYLFGQVIDLDILALMAKRDKEHALRELQGRSAEAILEARPSSGFDRATDFGLLRAYGPRRYVVEPALAGHSARLFGSCFPGSAQAQDLGVTKRPGRFSGSMAALAARTGFGAGPPPGAAAPESPAAQSAAAPVAAPVAATLEVDRTAGDRVTQAFVEACSAFGRQLAAAAELDQAHSLNSLVANEPTFRRAIEIARERKWWGRPAGALEALGELYDRTGCVAIWDELIESLQPDCSDPGSQKPLEGRELLWRPLAEQQVRLATRRGSSGWAIEMQRHAVEFDRRRCGNALNSDVRELSEEQRQGLLDLARSLNRLGSIARADNAPIDAAEIEAFEVCEALGEHERAAAWAFELGSDYTNKRAIQDLGKADRWLRRGLELLADQKEGASRFLAALGQVAWERFRAARSQERPEAELIRHLTDARQYFERAIENAPAYNHTALAQYNQLYGHVSYSLGDIDRSLPHYRESIRHDDTLGNVIGAARTRFSLAIALRDVGRLGEARKYATAVFDEIKELEHPSAEHLLDRARRLVENIEERIEVKRSKRRPGLSW